MSAKALKTIILMFPIMVLIAISSAIVFADFSQIWIMGQTYAGEGDTMSFKVTVYPANQNVTYIAEGLPEGSVFDGENFTWDTGIGDAGEYYVSFTATEGNYSISKQAILNVAEVNPKPGVCYFGDTNGDCLISSIDLGKAKKKTLGMLVYCIGTLPGDCSGLDINGNGYMDIMDEHLIKDMAMGKRIKIEGAPTTIINLDYPNVTEIGKNYEIKVRVTDIDGTPRSGIGVLFTADSISTGSAVLRGRDPNNGKSYVNAGEVFEVTNALKYDDSIQGFAGGEASITIKPQASGTIVIKTFVPGDAYKQVADFSGENIVIKVLPQIRVLGKTYANENDTVSFSIYTENPDNMTYSYSAENVPQGAEFDNINGTFSWKTNFGDAGDYSVKFTASDGEYIVEKNVSFNIAKLDPKPGVCYFGDTNGDCVPTIIEMDKPRDMTQLKAVDCTGTLPGDCSGLDLNGNGYIDLMDDDLFKDMIMLKDVQLDGAPTTIVNVIYPNETDINNTYEIKIKVTDIDGTPRSGIGVLFTIDVTSTGTAVLNGRDPNNGNQYIDGQSVFEITNSIMYDPNGYVGGEASIKITPLTNGTITIKTFVPGNTAKRIADFAGQDMIINVLPPNVTDDENDDDQGEDNNDQGNNQSGNGNGNQGSTGSGSSTSSSSHRHHSSGGIWLVDSNTVHNSPANPADSDGSGADQGSGELDNGGIAGSQEDSSNVVEGELAITGNAVSEPQPENDPLAKTLFGLMLVMIAIAAIILAGHRIASYRARKTSIETF